jgi:hypothetical protein
MAEVTCMVLDRSRPASRRRTSVPPSPTSWADQGATGGRGGHAGAWLKKQNTSLAKALRACHPVPEYGLGYQAGRRHGIGHVLTYVRDRGGLPAIG